MVRPVLALLVVLVAAVLPGCVSGDLAKKNLTNVRAQAQTLQVAGVAAPVQAVPTAEALEEATGTVEQVLAFGVPTELAAENLQHVSTMSDAIRVGGLEDPAPDALPVAQEIARQAGATEAAIRAIQPGAGPWWLPVAGIAGALGAAFTGLKTVNRILKSAKTKKAAAAPAAPAPTPAPPTS